MSKSFSLSSETGCDKRNRWSAPCPPVLLSVVTKISFFHIRILFFFYLTKTDTKLPVRPCVFVFVFVCLFCFVFNPHNLFLCLLVHDYMFSKELIHCNNSRFSNQCSWWPEFWGRGSFPLKCCFNVLLLWVAKKGKDFLCPVPSCQHPLVPNWPQNKVLLGWAQSGYLDCQGHIAGRPKRDSRLYLKSSQHPAEHHMFLCLAVSRIMTLMVGLPVHLSAQHGSALPLIMHNGKNNARKEQTSFPPGKSPPVQ